MYERLDMLLREHGITPYRLAKNIGMSQSSLSEWKRGNSVPKYENMVKIADYFNVPVSYLTGKEYVKPEIEDSHEAVGEGDKELLKRLIEVASEKLAEPEWYDEQAKQNLELFNSLSQGRKEEALRYLRYLVGQEEL